MLMRSRAQGTLKNCKTCGKVFVSMAGEKYCPTCLPLEREKQHKINEYVLEHPGAPLIDVLREARLTGEMGNSHELEDYMFIEGMVEGAPEVHVCASCGVSIAAGRTYCKECFQMLMRTVKHRAEYTKPSEEVVPRDPDRAAPIDVAELKRQAMLGGNEPNRPHGPGQEHVEEGKGKLRRYLGIIEYQE